MNLLCLWLLYGAIVFSAPLVSHHPSLSLAVIVMWTQTVQPVAVPGWLSDRSRLACHVFCLPLVNVWTVHPAVLCMSPVFSSQQLPCLIQTQCPFGLLGLFPSMHSSHVNTQKNISLRREPCFCFMQAHFLSSWVAMYVTNIFQLSPCLLFWNNNLCYPIYMMLLLYFRPVTEKKTPLLRNHSICSGPQRFPFVLIILLSETFISNRLALRSHSKLCFIRQRPVPDLI